MGHGGRRPGAGKPKGYRAPKTLARVNLKAYFETEARKHFDAVLAEYVKRAKGEPSTADPKIQMDFFNRLCGKPPEAVELTGTAGEPLIVRVVHRQLAE